MNDATSSSMNTETCKGCNTRRHHRGNDRPTPPLSGAAHAGGSWNEAGECLPEGAASLRDINRHLALHFPLDGPKTLNGWLLEELKDIPETNVSLKMDDRLVEIVQAQNQAIKVVKLIKVRGFCCHVYRKRHHRDLNTDDCPEFFTNQVPIGII